MSLCVLFGDLHIHSSYSDNPCASEEICDHTIAHNVGVITVINHILGMENISGLSMVYKQMNDYGLKMGIYR